MLPNAIIIGVQKAATTTIYEWLCQHYDVYGNPSMKEYNFFNNKENLSLGLSWFEKSFSGYSNEKICLHGFVKYIDDVENLIIETQKYNKDCKFIVSLRAPVERAYSAYWEGRKTARLSSKSFYDEVVTSRKNNGEIIINSNSLCIQDSLCSNKLKKLFSLVDKNNVKVVDYHRILSEPHLVISEIFEFLGVEKNFTPNFIKVNESGMARSFLIQKALQRLRAPNFLKRYVSGKTLSSLKVLFIRKLNVKKFEYPQMEPQIYSALRLFFKSEVEEIAKLTGIEFER